MTLKLKQIPDAKWSKTMSAWHIPYTKEAFKQLKELFPDVEYNNAGHVETVRVETVHAPSLQQDVPIDAKDKAIEAPIVEQNNENEKKILTLKKAEPAIRIKPELATKEPEMVSRQNKAEIKSAISITVYPNSTFRL